MAYKDSINELRNARKKKEEEKNNTARQTTPSAVASRLSSVEELREQRAQQSKATSNRIKNTEKNRNTQTTQRKTTPTLADSQMIKDLALQRMKQAQIGLQKVGGTSVGKSVSSNKPTTHSSSTGTWAERVKPNGAGQTTAQKGATTIPFGSVEEYLANQNKSIDARIAQHKAELEAMGGRGWSLGNSETFIKNEARDGKTYGVPVSEATDPDFVARYKELEKKITLLEREKNKNAKTLRWNAYKNDMQSEDFEEYAKRGVAIANPSATDVAKTTDILGGLWHWNGFDSDAYENVPNKVSFVRDNWDTLNSTAQAYITAEGDDRYLHLKEEEAKLYYSYLAKEQEGLIPEGSADAYLDYMQETLNYRKGIKKGVSDFEDIYDLPPVLRELATGKYGYGAAVESYLTGTKEAIGKATGLKDDVSPTSVQQYAGQYVRENSGKAGQFAYDIGGTAGNMAIPAMVSLSTYGIAKGVGAAPKVVQNVSAAAMGTAVGTSAAGNAYVQALSEGYTEDEAWLYAKGVGVSEGALSAVLSSVGGKLPKVLQGKANAIHSAAGRFFANLGLGIGGEITEEELQLLIEPAIRSVVFNEEYDAPTIEEALYTALITAVSTGGYALPGAINSAFDKSGVPVTETAPTEDTEAPSADLVSPIDLEDEKDTDKEAPKPVVPTTEELAPAQDEPFDVAGVDTQEDPILDAAMEVTAQRQETKAAETTDAKPSELDVNDEAKATDSAYRRFTGYGENGIKMFTEEVGRKGADGITVKTEMDAPYHAGRFGVGKDKVDLSTPIAQQAYNMGEMDRILDTAKDKKAAEEASVWGKEAGLIKNDYSNTLPLSKRSLLDEFAKQQGAKIVMRDRIYTDNKGGEANGRITSDGVIEVSMNADNPLEVVVTHEGVHNAKRNAPEAWEAFRDFAVKMTFGEYKPGSKDAIVRMREGYYRASNGDVILDSVEAAEEVATHFAERIMHGDEAFLKDVVAAIRTELAKEDASVSENGVSAETTKKSKLREFWESFLEWVQDKIAKLKALRKNPSIKNNSIARADLETTIENLERGKELLQNLFTESAKTVQAKRDAGMTFSEIVSEDGTVVVTNKNGDPVAMMTEEGSAQLSLKTWEDGGRDALVKWLDNRVKNKQITKAEADDIVKQMDEFHDICEQFVDKYAPFGAWSQAEVVKGLNGKPAFSVVKANGDYAMNLDFSLVCKKRRTLDAVFGEMIRRGIMDDVVLEEADIVRINDIIRTSGFETACALCFVDSKRYRQAMVTDNFVSKYNDMVEMLIPEGSDVSAHYFNYVGKAKDNLGKGLHSLSDADVADGIKKLKQVMKDNGEKTVPHKIAKHLLAHPEDRKFVRRSDFMNTDGFEEVSIKNPNIMKLYNSSKGSGGPKAAFSDVQYLGEILSKTNFTPARAYAVGGVRIQSFSDYIPRLVFDYLQMIGDLSAKKLPAHAYTKEALFAMQFGMTGIKVNMSLVPAVVEGGVAPGLDANGDYVWFDGQSFGSDVNVKGSGKTGFDLAVKIQNANGYSANCGTIAVGISKEHILKMLDDPNIRMIIPYHKSSLNHIVAMMNNIDRYENYTGVQNTRYADSDTKLDPKKHKDFNYNEALRRTGDAKKAADEYLAWCKKNNYIPKFDDFAWHENYYKLLEDFSTYDNGVAAPQGPVTMTFPKEGDAFGSMAQLIEQGLEEDAVLEGRREKNLPKIVDEIEGALKKKSAESSGTKWSLKTNPNTESRIAELESKLVTSVSVPVYSNGEVIKYITKENGRYKLTDDPSKAIVVKPNEQSAVDAYVASQYKKNPLRMIGTEQVAKPAKLSYAEKNLINAEISALRNGFDSVTDAKAYDQKRKTERLKADKASVDGSYFDQAARKGEPFYVEHGGEIICDYQSAARTIVSEAKRMGAEEVHTSAKRGSKFGSSVYLKMNGIEVRISDHHLPQTMERSDINYNQRWDSELVLTNGKMIDLAAKIKTRDDMKSFLVKMFDAESVVEDYTNLGYTGNNINGTTGGREIVDGQREVDYSGNGRYISAKNAGIQIPGSREGVEASDRFVGKGWHYDRTGERNVRNQDSEGRRIDPEILARLNETAIVDEEGRPILVYHATQADFDVFAKGDTGFHFGSETQANSLARQKQYERYRMIRAYLNIKNPAYCLRDTMGWHPPAAAMALWEIGVLSETEKNSIESLWQFGDGYDSVASIRLREMLREKGCDGIVYPNLFEGGGYSYIALYDEQIIQVAELGKAKDASKFSLKGVRELEDAHKQAEINDLLRKELKGVQKALSEQIAKTEKWKGELKRTKEPTVDKNSVDKLTRKILREYNSDADVSEISAQLKELGDALLRVNTDEGLASAKAKADEIARAIVEDSRETYVDSYLDGIRKVVRGTKIFVPDWVRRSIPDYEHFRRRNFGRMRLNHNDGIPIDVFWNDMNDQFGDVFNEAEVSNSVDQLLKLEEIVESATPLEFNPFVEGGAADEVIDTLGYELMVKLLHDVDPTPPTFADKQYEKRKQAVKEAKAQVRETERERANKRLTEERAKAKERLNRLLTEQKQKARERYEKKLEKATSYYREQMANASESRKAMELREKITRHVDKMSRKLLKPTKTQNIPVELHQAVADVLAAINMESNFEWVVGSDGKRRRVQKGADPNSTPTKRTEAFNRLISEYKKIAAANTYDIALDPNLIGMGEGARDMLQEIVDLYDIPISSMNSAQLTAVWNVLRAVEKTVLDAGKILTNDFMREKYEDRVSLANAFLEEAKTRRKHTTTDRHFTMDYMDPYTYFSQFGQPGLDFFRMLRNAQDDFLVKKNEIADMVNALVSAEKRVELEKDIHEFETQAGEKLILSKAHIMDMWLLNNRPQGKQHLLGGGIYQPTIKGKVKRGTEPTRLTELDLGKIFTVLTEEDRTFAQDFRKITDKLAEWGDKANVRVYGYEKFGDPNYWSIFSAAENTKRTVEKNPDLARSVGSIGAAKNTVLNANNPVNIYGMFEAFDRHSADMLNFAAWLAPMKDAEQLFNIWLPGKEGELTSGIFKNMLNRVGGAKSDSYWLDLMEDIQNGIKSKTESETGAFVEQAIGKVRKAAIAGNARVVIQQPTALARALVVIDPKYMTKGLVKGVTAGKGTDKARKYSPTAVRKFEGNFDMGTSIRSMAESFYKPESLKGKIIEGAKEAPLWAAGKADELAWGKLWNACEHQIADTRKDLSVGSDEWYAEVRALFDDAIDQTQVVDGILQRSKIMRSSNSMDKWLTAYKGEPLKTVNLVMRSWNNWRYQTDPVKRSAARKKWARALFALSVNAVLNGVAQSLWDGIRDDDDEEKYLKRVWNAFIGLHGDEETWRDYVWGVMTSNLVSGFNPLSMLPGLSDLWSIAEGFDVNRPDAEAFSRVMQEAKNLIGSVGEDGGKQTVGYSAARLLTRVAYMFGSGSSNLLRDIEGVIRSIQVETDDYEGLYKTEKLKYDVVKNKSKFIGILYRAYAAGDTEAYNAIYNDLIKSGVSEKSITSAMETRMMKAEGVAKASELDDRWLSPTKQKQYDKTMSPVKKSSLWKSASAKQQSAAENLARSLANGSNEEAAEKIKAGSAVGLSSDEWVMYQLALDMHDTPNSKGKLGGSPTASEKANAVLAVDGLSDAEMAYLFDGKYQDGKAYRADEFGLDMGEYLLYRIALDKAAKDLDTTTASTKAKKEALKQFDFTAKEKAYLKKEK